MTEIKLPKLRKVGSKKKKKILLLSDDMRMHSGVATMSKEFILGTIREFDWVQIAGAIKHPEKGKMMDLSLDAVKETGVEDASLVLYPTDGYGNPDMLREVLLREKPDAIMHFTDPRFWGWLYQMEHELRQTTPIIYYTIWDDLPFPYWNEPFYESCDLLMCISKQTYNIVKNVIQKFPKPDWAITYVPHGINEKVYFPIEPGTPKYSEMEEFRKKVFGSYNIDFIVFYNNRNIRRKQPGDIILAYKLFCDSLPKDKAAKCALLMHTQPVDENGTDLVAVVDTLCPDYKVLFSDKRATDEELNLLYNISDVTINIASNEGFGLTTAESLMAGTPIVVNVTGGLQDQCGFEKNDGTLVTIKDFNENWGSNHNATYKKHGKWAYPVFPSNRSLQGSVPTPYIFDDRVKFEDVAEAIKYWYRIPSAERKQMGKLGREYMIREDVGMSSKEMANRMIKDINNLLEKWTPRKRFAILNSKEIKSKPIGTSGVVI
jgi:glycosyltransferase involved in cell wall biosynthesis